MPKSQLEDYEDILLIHFKSMLDNISTDRLSLLKKLKRITNLAHFKTHLKLLTSAEHDQGAGWEPGLLSKGSRLRDRLLLIQKIIKDVEKPLTLKAIKCNDIKSYSMRSTHIDSIRKHLEYIDGIVKDPKTKENEIPNLSEAFSLVTNYIDEREDKQFHAKKTAIFDRLTQYVVDLYSEDSKGNIFECGENKVASMIICELKKIDERLFDNTYFTHMMPYIEKELKTIVELYLAQSEPAYAGFSQRIKTNLMSSSVINNSNVLKKIFYFQVACIVSIEQFRYGTFEKYQEQNKLGELLQDVNEVLEVELPSEQKDKLDYERFLKTYSPLHSTAIKGMLEQNIFTLPLKKLHLIYEKTLEGIRGPIPMKIGHYIERYQKGNGEILKSLKKQDDIRRAWIKELRKFLDAERHKKAFDELSKSLEKKTEDEDDKMLLDFLERWESKSVLESKLSSKALEQKNDFQKNDFNDENNKKLLMLLGKDSDELLMLVEKEENSNYTEMRRKILSSYKSYQAEQEKIQTLYRKSIDTPVEYLNNYISELIKQFEKPLSKLNSPLFFEEELSAAWEGPMFR